MSIVYDLIKATQLPQVENPDLERFIIANGNDLATAPMYFLLDKIQTAMEQAAAANVAVNGVVLNAQQAAQKAQTAFLAGQELQSNVFDTEGYYYANKIRPLSIDTTLISLGARSQQFSLPGVNFTLNTDFTSLSWTTGQIIHQTIDEPNLRTWNITGGTVSTPAGFLNIYVRAVKVGTTATIIATTDQLTVDEDATYFHFKVGYISSLINGVRIIKTTYGFAQINPAEISIGRISSPTGGNYIDLLYDRIVINGRVNFTSGSSGYENLTDKPDLTPYNEVVDYVNNTLPNELTEIQNQIDGNITSWFYDYVPTTANAPASNWTTTEQKNAHLGDLFYDTVTGYAYRYQLVGGTYSWQRLTDTDVTKALADAAAAQDTADSKRRVFVVEPTTPYDIGDLWTQGPTGVIMRAIVSRAGGAYVASDWEKADKYTDDTRAILAEAAAKEYTDKQAILTKLTTEAYVDGKVDETEQIAIDAAEKALADAYDKLNELTNNFKEGGVQMLREYDIAFDFKYWGGTGTAGTIDIDGITIIEAFAIGVVVGVDEFAMEHESGLIFEIAI